jgi:3-isopropylmalate dehydrogenase
VSGYNVIVLPGDGVGPEVTRAAVRVLDAAGRAFGLTLRVEERPVGWAAVQRSGEPLPAATLDACLQADAVFLGAVGHPDADDAPPEARPEAGLLALRAGLGCHTNLRPVRVSDALTDASPLRPERIQGTDMMIVRELAGGLYYGEPRGREGSGAERRAWNTLVYTAPEIERVARTAFTLAEGRRGRVTSVDKANVLDVSRLWREVVSEVAREFPSVRCDHMLVDRAAMEVVLRPGDLDVILTSNLFGDVLSDAAAGAAGSLGLLPSASLGSGVPLFEPVHGSAPDLAGKDLANPIGAILSMAMLLEHGLSEPGPARAIEGAVDRVLDGGLRTADLAGPDDPTAGTQEFADAIVQQVAAAGRAPATNQGRTP